MITIIEDCNYVLFYLDGDLVKAVDTYFTSMGDIGVLSEILTGLGIEHSHVVANLCPEWEAMLDGWGDEWPQRIESLVFEDV